VVSTNYRGQKSKWKDAPGKEKTPRLHSAKNMRLPSPGDAEDFINQRSSIWGRDQLSYYNTFVDEEGQVVRWEK